MQYIKFTTSVNEYDLKDHLWSGGLDTYNKIFEHGLTEELIVHLNEVFCGETPDITSINDYLWFDSETVYEAVGLDAEGETPIDLDMDGKVTERYLNSLWGKFDGETDLTYDVQQIGKEEHANADYNGTYTTMEIYFDSPIDMDNMTSEQAEQYIDTLENLSRTERGGNNIIVNEYKITVDRERKNMYGEPLMYLDIMVLGRITTVDIDKIFAFMNEIYNLKYTVINN